MANGKNNPSASKNQVKLGDALSGVDDLQTVFSKFRSQLNKHKNIGAKVVLETIYKNPALIPENVKGDDSDQAIEKWINKFNAGYERRISARESGFRGTIQDPIILSILEFRLGLSQKQLKAIDDAHEVMTAAENTLGSFLEEYLFSELKKYGWYCCWGETVKAVDFCNSSQKLLQIKNRSNTENSSSSKIRNGTEIKKWYRIEAKTGKYHWEKLNTMLEITDNKKKLTERKFINFVIKVIQSNPKAVAINEKNIWTTQDTE